VNSLGSPSLNTIKLSKIDMSKTFRNFPRDKWLRTPKHKHKILGGDKKGDITTNWDDKPVAARKESWKDKNRY